MAPKLQEVADELERRESLRFSLVPHDETKFRVWKFGAMRDIKAKLMTIKYREGMETAVEAYIAAMQNSQTMEIHKDLATSCLFNGCLQPGSCAKFGAEFPTRRSV